MYKMKEEMKVFRRTKGSKRWDYGNEQCYICLNFFFFKFRGQRGSSVDQMFVTQAQGPEFRFPEATEK